MNHAQLLSLLQAQNAEVQDIAGKVQTLLDAVKNADNVPQYVQDAAAALGTSLDALKTEAAG